MFLLAGFQVFCARVANTLLTSWSPLTYELGDYFPAYPSVKCDGCGSTYSDTLVQPCYTCRLADKEAEEEDVDYQAVERQWRATEDAMKKPGTFSWGSTSFPYFPDPSSTRQAGSPPPVGDEGPDGVVRHSPASTVGVPTLPMFDAKDLESIAAYYLVHHFPWPDEDGKFHCCRTTGLTITEWSQHVSELQVSELVFTLQGLVYDQSQ